MDFGYDLIVKNLYVAKLENDYGEIGVQKALFLSENIKNLFKHVYLENYNRLVIATSLNDDTSLHEKLNLTAKIEDSSFNKIMSSSSESIFVEFTSSGKICYSENFTSDIKDFNDTAVIYERENEKEYFHTLSGKDLLEPLNGVESYFSPYTFKNLNEAFDYYESKFARTSACPILSMVWDDANRIKFIKGKAEEVMRNSLCYFLRANLRDDPQVMPEQNVNEKNPVDIKVTWNFTDHIALIEIKWVGNSISGVSYRDARANSGAKQLADYLDEFKSQEPTRVVKGYLVVFDARRKNVTKPISELTQSDVEFYKNVDITYNPEYEKIRQDYAPPVRFFLEAKLNN